MNADDWVYHPGFPPTITFDAFASALGIKKSPCTMNDVHRAQSVFKTIDVIKHMREHNKTHGGIEPRFPLVDRFQQVCSQHTSARARPLMRSFSRARTQIVFYKPRVSVALLFIAVINERQNYISVGQPAELFAHTIACRVGLTTPHVFTAQRHQRAPSCLA